MRPRVLLFTILSAFLFVSAFVAPADARLRAGSLPGIPSRTLGEDVVIPAAWAGIWTFVDSTYDCQGSLIGTDSGVDTLCTGQSGDPGEGEPFPVECSGTITDNSIDYTCSYSEVIDKECTLSFTVVLQGTMSTNSYVLTNTVTLSAVGTSKACLFFPGSCTRTVSRGTRTAPEPVAYCATPVDETTWGRMKSRYR